MARALEAALGRDDAQRALAAHRLMEERRRPSARIARRLRRLDERHHPAILLGIAGLALALAVLAWHSAARDAEDDAQRRFESEARLVGAAISGRVQDYERVLRGARGLFEASQVVERREWHAYVRSLELQENYPGLQLLAYADRVPAADRDRHVRALRAQGLPDYAISPGEDRPEYFPLVFLEPSIAPHPRALGLDLASESSWGKALEHARDTGRTALASPLTLAADRVSDGDGVLMVMPVYRPQAPVATVPERRAALAGFVCAAFRAEQLVRAVLEHDPSVTLRLYDASAAGESALLFGGTSTGAPPRFNAVVQRPVIDRTWRIEAASTPAFEATIDRERPRFTLVAGLLVGATAVTAAWILLTLRAAALGLANRMTDELRETEERFRLLVDAVHDYAIFMVDADGFVATWNAGAERTSGYLAEEILGRHMSVFYLPEAVAAGKPQQDLARALRDGRTEDEGWRLRSDGGRIWATVVLSAVHNAAGELVGVANVTRDLTERIRARERLRESEERLALALKSSNLASFDWNLETGEVLLSPEWAVMIGDERGAVRTTVEALQRVVHPDDLPRVEAQVWALVKGEIGLYDLEHRVRTRAGEWRWISSIAQVTDRDEHGRAHRVTGTNADITERKRVERIKDEFVATVSHELRTPLTAVLGSLALLREGSAGELPTAAQPLVEMGYQNTERLNALVNDILDIARLESGRMEFSSEVVDLAPFLERALALNASYAERYGVRFALDAPTGLRIVADAHRLLQVITNLLSNAAKFSPPGGEVRVSAQARDGRVTIAVRDRGRGILPEFEDRVFERFAQADSSDSRHKGGTGLGLAIAKAMVEQMDGRIWFESEMNRETVFFVELPLAEPGQPVDTTVRERPGAVDG
jgi:PAS domain S-box-containing protein